MTDTAFLLLVLFVFIGFMGVLFWAQQSTARYVQNESNSTSGADADRH